ncbi:MAG: peptidoglycan DD-metalloendopeptidase family protein [Psychrobium sp.]|nr:peptidoglycan DD-metalloendopeptidase family protein [Psychrobium sp.]
MITIRSTISAVLISILCSVIFGCASSTGPAPVSSLSKASKNSYPIKITGKRYKVRKGDTLYSISFAARMSAKTLSSINNINPPYVIYSGTWLSLVKKKKPLSLVKKNEVSKKWHKKLVSQKKVTYSKNVTKPQRSTATAKKKKYVAKQNSYNAKKISKWIWPATGRVISAYSASAQGNNGLDIAGLKGSKILATAAGKVVYAGNALRGYGNLIIIKHNDDFLSAYAHNEKIFVKEKQRIKQGQLIAQMGRTESSRVQLHFEIRFRGKSVNPANYLPKR